MSLRINVYETFGLPDPSLYPGTGDLGDPIITGEVKKPLGSPTMLWVQANWFFLVLAGIFLVIALFAPKGAQGIG